MKNLMMFLMMVSFAHVAEADMTPDEYKVYRALGKHNPTDGFDVLHGFVSHLECGKEEYVAGMIAKYEGRDSFVIWCGKKGDTRNLKCQFAESTRSMIAMLSGGGSADDCSVDFGDLPEKYSGPVQVFNYASEKCGRKATQCDYKDGKCQESTQWKRSDKKCFPDKK